MATIDLTMTRGSDFIRTMTFGADVGDITGWTFDVIDVFPAIMTSKITCTVTDGPAGVAQIQCDWGNWWPLPKANTVVSFYIRPSGLDASLPEFRITIQ